MDHGFAVVVQEVLPAPAAQVHVPARALLLLVERAKARLRGSSHKSLRSISCDFAAGALRLQGKVPSFYLKQVAQNLLLSMAENPPVQNELVVAHGPRRSAK